MVPRKYNHILRFTGGPQREDKAFAETYRYHTPGSLQKEAFDSFSTILLGAGSELGPDAVQTLATVLEAISDQPQAVVELERVIGVLEAGGVWHEADLARVPEPTSLHAPELAPFRRLRPAAASRSTTPSTSPRIWRRWTNRCPSIRCPPGPIWVAGSCSTREPPGPTDPASSSIGRLNTTTRCVGQRRLTEHLEALGLDYTLRTLVELVLGIWRGGPQPVAFEPVRSRPWASGRCRRLPGRTRWLGHRRATSWADSSPDVNRAMLQNLGEGVTYTYFLHTHAD